VWRCFIITPAQELSRHLSLLILFGVLAACSAATTATDTPSSVSDQSLPSRLETFLTKRSKESGFSGSVLVAREGRVLLSNGYGEADRDKKIPNTAKTKFRIASITKQFTAMAVLLLQARGKLNVQDRVCSYISNCPTAWETITLHHLLTHTSGLPNYYTSPDWVFFQATPMAPSDITAHFMDKSLDFQPGEKWNYSNSGYVLLGTIIEQVSGMTYGAFIKENILDPLMMADTGYLDDIEGLAVGYATENTTTPANFEDMSGLYASGGMYSTVGDLYLWDQALYTDKLIPRDLRDKIFTSYAMMTDGSGWGYGYGWTVGVLANHRMVGHPGRIEGFSSLNTYYPDDKVVVIVLSNQRDPPAYDIGYQLAKYFVFGSK
jgi:CubicO group peptidase (beta-lactamase class C family)